jgi:precorrin-8X/cobalt-precorrin-8 methylmutase
MRVIEDEIGAHGYGRMEWPVVRRVIHSTADFDFAMMVDLVLERAMEVENANKKRPVD